jgi:hypothetical protein
MLIRTGINRVAAAFQPVRLSAAIRYVGPEHGVKTRYGAKIARGQSPQTWQMAVLSP